MSRHPMKVTLDIDASAFVAAMSGVAKATASFHRALEAVRLRLHSHGGDYLDRVIKECLDRRLTVDETTFKLTIAADLADILDNAFDGPRRGWQRS